MTAAYQALVGVALRKGDYGLLERSADEIIKADPISPRGYGLLASVRQSQHDAPGVEAALQKAIGGAPHNSGGYTQVANWRFSQRRSSEQAKCSEKASEVEAESSD